MYSGLNTLVIDVIMECVALLFLFSIRLYVCGLNDFFVRTFLLLFCRTLFFLKNIHFFLTNVNAALRAVTA
jgi:hypothetical protein